MADPSASQSLEVKENTGDARAAMKSVLTGNEFLSFPEKVLGFCAKLIQQLLRLKSPVPLWAGTLFFAGSFFAIRYGLAFLPLVTNVGDELVHPDLALLQTLVDTVLVTSSLFAMAAYARRARAKLADPILDFIESTADFEHLHAWLRRLGQGGLQVLFALLFGLTMTSFQVIRNTAGLGRLPLVEWLIILPGFLIVSMSGIVIALLFLFLLLFWDFRRYHFRLFPENPASSPIIREVGALADRLVYTFVVLALVNILLTVVLQVGFDRNIMIGLLVPVVLIFFVKHGTLTHLIDQAKTIRLTELQGQVAAAQSGVSLLTLDQVNLVGKILDLHDRVKASPGSSLNLRSVLSLVNQLLGPLIVYLIGNYDELLDLAETLGIR